MNKTLPRNNYARWWREKLNETNAQGQSELGDKPLISILMPVYNAQPGVLLKAIRSVIRQTYTNWELCIVDDCSTRVLTRVCLKSIFHRKIKVKFLPQNQNISGASNQAAAMASGDYLGLLDNDDELTPDALYQMVRRINQTQADLIYSDEDFIDADGEYESPHFKPDFSPDLLLSHNYITHFTLFKKGLFFQVRGFRARFDGAQDYDLLLRLSEVAGKIEHVPHILYHWRRLETSSSMSTKAKPYTHERGKAAVISAVKRRGIDAVVEDGNLINYYRVKRRLRAQPLLSIVIPFKDKPKLLTQCLNSILQTSSYANFEVIGVSNHSQEKATFDAMQRYADTDPRIQFIEHNVAFNFSALVNKGVSASSGDHVVLMNNDIEIINHDWLESLLEHSQRDEIAVVGCKLYFADNKIQHAGVGVALGGAAGHLHLRYPRHASGYFNRLNVIQNMSALTGALMMVQRSIYDELNGFNEDEFKIAYNDVDFCLRAIQHGYLNLFTPYCEAYHYESISRGYDIQGEKLTRLNLEKKNLWKIHGDLLKKGDPYYNVNLDQNRDDFELPYKPIVC